MIATSVSPAFGRGDLMVVLGRSGLLRHDGAGGDHAVGNSIWMLVSMIAFSVFLLMIAWTLVRPRKHASSAAADALAEQYAHGELGDDEFASRLRDLRSGHR